MRPSTTTTTGSPTAFCRTPTAFTTTSTRTCGRSSRWEPDRPVHEIAVDYARFFFRPDLAEVGADAILALETNLHGSMAENGSIDGTLRLWQQIEQRLSGGADQLAVRYAPVPGVLRRLHAAPEDLRERTSKSTLSPSWARPSRSASRRRLSEAREILERTTTEHRHPEWLKRTEELADLLFHKIGYQTSVEHYHGSGPERGCVMDFVNYPAQRPLVARGPVRPDRQALRPGGAAQTDRRRSQLGESRRRRLLRRARRRRPIAAHAKDS